MLYAGSNIDANKTGDNNYLQINSINASTSGTIQSGANYAVLYLKGTVVGNTFTISASPYLTTVVPSTDNGYCYIPIGTFYNSTTNIYFNSSNQLYAYKDGAFGPVSIREASAAAKTATNYLYFDSTNGLVVSQTGKVSTGYNTQITSTGMNIRNGTTTLASYGSSITLG